MMTERQVREKLDMTVNRLVKFKEDFAKDPRYPDIATAVERAYVSRIKTLEEVLGIGTWDEKEVSKNLKLDERTWT